MAGGTYGASVSIPVIMIGRNDGDILISCLDTICNGINATIASKKVSGNIFYDFYFNDCIRGNSENGIRGISATINPGNISVNSNFNGDWFINSLPVGNYTITYDTTSYWHSNCSLVDTFSINNSDAYTIVDTFGMKPNFGVVRGNIFHDINENCVNDFGDFGLSSRYLIINPGNIISQSDANGFFFVDSLIFDSYSITLDTSSYFINTCASPLNFIVNGTMQDSIFRYIGLKNNSPCPVPTISIHMPIMRPCSSQDIYVRACNLSTTSWPVSNAYVEITLDSLLTPTSSSIPFTSLGSNSYSFDIGTLNPGQCIDFIINTTVSCNAILGQTLCMQANLYPADSCVFDTTPTPIIGGVQPCTLPWDKSSLSVNGWCQNDSIYFTVTNTGTFGNGDMQCYAPIRIYIDGVLTTIDSVLLVGGQTQTFIFEADGRTWRLEADQHPLHPGNSHPNATVELCGNIANWTPNLVNSSPQNDADPVVDIYCGVVTGSYDPNDKTGYPLGVSSNHFVTPNGKIDYVIRFQNTGTDTAFTVVIRDTLDVDLDIFSVQSGVSSHDYTFKMFGPRVLEWTFSNIMLPDSAADQEGSNGFVTFTVNQNPDLADGTEINNSVGIYFDFNAPVITNTTSHIINRGINYLLSVKENKIKTYNNLMVFPNPTKNQLNIILSSNQNTKIEIFSIEGKLVEQQTIQKNSVIDVSKYNTGLYFIQATTNDGKIYRNKFVKE